MPRKARMIVEGESAVYHVMSRTALDGYVLGDVEKDYLLQLIKHLSNVYFAEILGFCIMGNHFHVVMRMHPGHEYTDEDISKQFSLYYQKDKIKRLPMPNQIPVWREKFGKLSEFMKELKQCFSRYYNQRHKRRGFFWSDRFKSVLVEDGEPLINCLAYVDLNPVRAAIVERPDDYRWNSLGYHRRQDNKDEFLSLDFGITGCEEICKKESLKRYRQFVYEVGSLETSKGKSISAEIAGKEAKKGFSADGIDRFRARTRYFTDSGIIGSKDFVSNLWQKLKSEEDNPNKLPTRIGGLGGLFSLKRLSERG
jgi:REP element-mobilizing transposase RayT